MSLRLIYGEIILKQGTVLYHSSKIKEEYKNQEKPMLFCSLHPDENSHLDDYVKRIKLIKDVSLFFMIEDINKDNNAYLISALPTLINNPNGQIAKIHNEQLIKFVDELKKEEFDGWLDTVYRKIRFEIALINDQNIFKPIGKNIIFRNIKNSPLNKLISLNDKYNISTLENPAIININKRFKIIIEKYIKYGYKNDFDGKNGFFILLKNAIINYHDSDYSKIYWENTYGMKL